MITKTMKKWLQGEYQEFLKRKRGYKGRRGSVKVAVYFNRLQKRIDTEMKMLLWLALNRPDILLNKCVTLNEWGNVAHSRDQSHERLKTLMLVIKALMKKENVHVELVKNEQ